MTWLVSRPFVLRRAVVVILLACIVGAVAVAQESRTGSLVLQSPVQAVATINGQGAFLLVPGKDLRWGQIRPGTYMVAVRSGAGQQWQHQVQIESGQTETLVAALSSAGIPLNALAPPPLPDTGRRVAPAYVPPTSESPSVPSLSPSAPSTAQHHKEDLDDRDAERNRKEREERLAEKRRRDAENRAIREAQQRAREAAEEEEKSRRRRPKVH